MNKFFTWGIILVTGASAYGLTYASSQFPDWAVILGSVNTAVVLICGKLTGFPKQEK
jgi:hypothetical protein